MRMLNAIKSDIWFQFKQGFYFIYIIITIFYLIILSCLPENISRIGVPFIVFTDPSVLGLFFIGGIIMLEKLQGVIHLLVVTPIRINEYLLSKIISLSIISTLVGLVITLVSYKENVNWFVLILALLLTSCFFTLMGFLIGAGCHTINQYFVKMIPYMLLLILPCFSIIGFPYGYLLTTVPSTAALRLLLGTYYGMPIYETVGLIIYLTVINYITFSYVKKVFENKVIYGV